MRKTLSDRGVSRLKPRATRYAYPDPECVGLYIRVQPTGAKSFVCVAVDPRDKKQVWATIRNAVGIEDARERARKAMVRIREGLDPFETPPPKALAVEQVCEQWLKRHVHKNGLRSEREIIRLLRAHVYPAWRDRVLVGIRRSDVAALLDDVEDNHGARQADYVLAILSSMMNWHAARDDTFVPPIVKKMRRTSPKTTARKRYLNDDELRAFWKATEDGSPYSAFVRLLLLTAQRREKVLAMRWQDLSLDFGVWVIPADDAREKGDPNREKGNLGTAQLARPALDLVKAQPRMGDNPYVFPGRRGGHMNDLAKCKRILDARMPAGTPHWQLHDLRRTARSLLSRASVSSDHAERVMGHVIGGVEGIYDKHTYQPEKTEALARLATLIDNIVNPRENVVPMAERRVKS
jgi:integrase